ncbi:potassium-transporting ATPase subunit KdpC [Magnetospirillum aberrantis]|uniref:Potassium-transporting ATPase KdpC subunit n=1 Tax=Magnetospirillum aberrantis SpK TaxID=908842 RepID=A0A7C9UUR2_9PROT|nr:potassium-transporting ATPase subunit KdpC [Magnetospirillum aberrantis]NFV78932.1 potassium-transporting ATPase subunit KdpC [Magnetospirillum aberrantis SpK]
MLKELRPALSMMIAMTVVTGIAYPLAVTGIAQSVFPSQAGGSLIEKDGKVIGSELIGQPFTGPGYFWGRPSATSGADPNDPAKTTSVPYNAANSSGSNYGPTSKALIDGAAANIEALKAAHPDQKGPVPADLVTASGSGLDPHITPASAAWQVKRIASARHAPFDAVQQLVGDYTEGRDLGILGEPRVNVLKLNLALDDKWPLKK